MFRILFCLHGTEGDGSIHEVPQNWVSLKVKRTFFFITRTKTSQTTVLVSPIVRRRPFKEQRHGKHCCDNQKLNTVNLSMAASRTLLFIIYFNFLWILNPKTKKEKKRNKACHFKAIRRSVYFIFIPPLSFLFLISLFHFYTIKIVFIVSQFLTLSLRWQNLTILKMLSLEMYFSELQYICFCFRSSI